MEKLKLWMGDIAIVEDNIWFSAGQFNGLFRVGLNGGEAEYVDAFPNEPKYQFRRHNKVIYYRDKILFLPDLSDYITIYNLKEKEFYCIKYPISQGEIIEKSWPKTAGAILIGCQVFIYGENNPSIIRYDFETGEIKVYREWFETFKTFGYRKKTNVFCKDLYHVNDSIFARTHLNHLLIEFNIVSEKFTFHSVGNQISSVLCGDGERLWFFAEEGMNFSSWNISNHLLETIPFGSDRRWEIERRYESSVNLQNEIWMFPYATDQILVMDKRNKQFKIKELDEIDESKRFQHEFHAYTWFRKVYKSKLYFMSVLENRLFCFEDSEHKVFCSEIYICKDRLMECVYSDFDVIHEGKAEYELKYSLSDLILCPPKNMDISVQKQEKYGDIIYSYIKSDNDLQKDGF